jgi:N-terminal acetyltransferase B complex non-catalytic subunit
MRRKDDSHHKSVITKDYLEKLKENNKLFEKKMISLNQKKIEDKSNKKRIKRPLMLSIRNEIQLNFKNYKKRSIFRLTKEKQMTITNTYRNYSRYKNRNRDLKIDKTISFNFINFNKGHYTEEEQDVLFIAKIRQLQKDIKYKTDLILDLQDKLKERDDSFLKIKKIQTEELTNRIEMLKKDNLEKVRRIKELEAENYNQKVIIDKYEGQIDHLKNNAIMRNDEIDTLSGKVEKYEEKINFLEIANKASLKDYESLKKEYNKIKNDNENIERIIDDQKLKMENYRKHINTLRKYICEEDETNEIDYNNNIIAKNYETISNNNNKIDNVKKNVFQDNYEKNYENNYENNDHNTNNTNDYISNGINKEKNIYNVLDNIIMDSGSKHDNEPIIASIDFDKGRNQKNNSDLIHKIKEDLNEVKKIKSSLKKNKSKNRVKIKDLKTSDKKKNRTIDIDNSEEDENIYYKTCTNLNDLKNKSHTPKSEKNKEKRKKSLNDLDDMTYFPSERHLVERADELRDLESKLDVLYQEKNHLESEITKLPEHPKTLREIKIKKALNEQLSINGNNINNIKKKIRKAKKV